VDDDRVEADTREKIAWPDADLVSWAAQAVSVPKVLPANSFVLHAPLELMARVELLDVMDLEHRDGAKRRIVELAHAYEFAGEAVAAPRPVTRTSSGRALNSLARALEASDLVEVDRLATWCALNVPVREIRRELGARLAPSLAAAAHGTIGLELVGRSAEIDATILRGALREVGRRPAWRTEWSGLARGDRPLVDALVVVPHLGVPRDTFIRSMVVHGAEVARQLLVDVSNDPVEGARSISRVAAWSMLRESDEHVPYGWTHALTIPQSLTAIDLDAGMAVSVAASQLVGIRASLGAVDLGSPESVPPSDVGFTEVATWASLHHDAHFVKYTLACVDAARADPSQHDLYLAAALRLARWWRDHDAASAASRHEVA